MRIVISFKENGSLELFNVTEHGYAHQYVSTDDLYRVVCSDGTVIFHMDDVFLMRIYD